ncbi:MAG: hypothetical protein ABIH34_05525, partial [Nanoarchaeota archaeon]
SSAVHHGRGTQQGDLLPGMMGLIDVLRREKHYVHQLFYPPSTKEGMVDHLKQYPLEMSFRRYQPQREAALNAYVEEAKERYAPFLQSGEQTFANTMAVCALGNDTIKYLMVPPLLEMIYPPLNVIPLTGKALAEGLFMFRYVRATRDYKGLLKWAAIKPIEFVIPLYGPLTSFDLPDRIVKSYMMNQAKQRFMEEQG